MKRLVSVGFFLLLFFTYGHCEKPKYYEPASEIEAKRKKLQERQTFTPEEEEAELYFKNLQPEIYKRMDPKNVTNMNYDDSKISDEGLKYLKYYTSLYDLYLKRTQITDKGIEYLIRSESISLLDLEGVKITNKGIEHIAKLKNLRNLNISENPNITNDCIRYLLEIKNLKELNVYNTSITEKGRAMLLERFPNLELIYEPVY